MFQTEAYLYDLKTFIVQAKGWAQYTAYLIRKPCWRRSLGTIDHLIKVAFLLKKQIKFSTEKQRFKVNSSDQASQNFLVQFMIQGKSATKVCHQVAAGVADVFSNYL